MPALDHSLRIDLPEMAMQKLPVAYSANYVRYAVGILTVVYIFNFTDRQILSILMQPIKEEMQLSDTQLGFLSGIAFAIFYATLGLPIARLADRYSRVNIITISLSIWSLMTTFSGMAGNFYQLLAARIGVGVGEAGGSPPSHSLIADFVPIQNRSTALGVFSLGVPLGLLAGFLIGGWLEELYGWRIAFFAVGAPGLILAVILRLTLKEPPRGHSQGGVKQDAEQSSMKQVVRYMWGLRTFRHIAAGAALMGFAGYGVIQWLPSFLHRSHHMNGGEIGSWLALIIGVGGAIGAAGGGYLADRLSKRDMRWQLWLPALGASMGAPFAFGVYLSEMTAMALGYLFIPMIFISFYLGPAVAMTQTLAPVNMRATASAVLLFVINLIGLGLGPQAVGIMSDLLRPAYGDDSLRYAMLLVSMFYVWGAYHFVLAAKTLREDLAQAGN